MKLKKDILIHIGYHKTGSSFLQKKVFNNSDSGLTQIGSMPDYFEQIIMTNPFAFDGQKVVDFFSSQIEVAQQKQLVPTLSAEAFSGQPDLGRYNKKDLADLEKLF